MGWVLSPSDFESFHLAIIEGAAAGCVPVIWGWEAASYIYDGSLLVDSEKSAVDRIANTSHDEWLEQSARMQGAVLQEFEVANVAKRYAVLFQD